MDRSRSRPSPQVGTGLVSSWSSSPLQPRPNLGCCSHPTPRREYHHHPIPAMIPTLHGRPDRGSGKQSPWSQGGEVLLLTPVPQGRGPSIDHRGATDPLVFQGQGMARGPSDKTPGLQGGTPWTGPRSTRDGSQGSSYREGPRNKIPVRGVQKDSFESHGLSYLSTANPGNVQPTVSSKIQPDLLPGVLPEVQGSWDQDLHPHRTSPSLILKT